MLRATGRRVRQDVRDLVADRPDDDAGVVAVAAGPSCGSASPRTARSDSPCCTRSAVSSHLSKASSQTTKPMRSQRSSSSGAGGLWLVRMALHAHVAHDLELPLHRAREKPRRAGPGRGGGTRLELHAATVEVEAVVGGELERADAEGRLGRRPPACRHGACVTARVEPRRCDVPTAAACRRSNLPSHAAATTGSHRAVATLDPGPPGSRSAVSTTASALAAWFYHRRLARGTVASAVARPRASSRRSPPGTWTGRHTQLTFR